MSADKVSCVKCDLQLHPIPLDRKWGHLARIQLADSGFGDPGKIDNLLGVEVFAEMMRHGRELLALL